MNLVEIAERVRQHPRLVIADDYEIAIHETCRNGVHYLNGTEKNATLERRIWLGLRVFHRKRSGRSSTENISASSIDSVVNQAFQSAEYSAVDPWFRFPLWRAPKPIVEKKFELTETFEPLYPLVATPPDQVHETYTEEISRVWLGRKTERLVLTDTSQVVRARWSLGPDGFSDSRLLFKSPQASALRDRWFNQLLTSYFAFDDASAFLDPVETSVLIGPKVTMEIVERLAPFLCADVAQAGRSFLADGIGKKVFSEHLKLVDDGTAPGQFAFDMEGVLAQETILINEGVLRGLLYDTQTAARANRISTGSVKLFGGEATPRIRPSHLRLSGIKGVPVPDLLSRMDKGICGVEIEEWVAGSNPYEALALVAGWLVAQGRCVEPVRRIPLRIDLRTLFQQVDGVGTDETPFDGCTVPSILLRKMPLSS